MNENEVVEERDSDGFLIVKPKFIPQFQMSNNGLNFVIAQYGPDRFQVWAGLVNDDREREVVLGTFSSLEGAKNSAWRLLRLFVSYTRECGGEVENE